MVKINGNICYIKLKLYTITVCYATIPLMFTQYLLPSHVDQPSIVKWREY